MPIPQFKPQKLSAQFYRQLIRYLFLISILIIGFQFIVFVDQLDQGKVPDISRPPGVEAFLPISALISLKYWLKTGILNEIHPSGLLILIFICGSSLLLKKVFCSWICPIGLLNEWLSKLHLLIFRKGLRIHPVIDLPLRSLKYLLAFFFLWAVFFQMDVLSLEKFIYSPYNRMADIKMLKFFTEISATTFWVTSGLILLSVLIRDFWCRYLCPYGALLGALSSLGIFKIRRDQITCTNCLRCDKICPSQITVSKVSTVYSDECHACQKCVDICPEKETLIFSNTQKGLHLKATYIGIGLLLIFAGGSFLGRLTGNWQNNISNKEYLYHSERSHEFIYGHNRGAVPGYNRQKLEAEILDFSKSSKNDQMIP
ncbi:MAG: 4Fe-4S binding protein [Deltaproteobacteria bacterium]|jgi:polyferredoxin|nr:4Fe-4S binding protein [Deltaproteobacteria bacterium]MBT4526000.1 4Fe-4S binding protein [Deltaproteobacteria bacterium]